MFTILLKYKDKILIDGSIDRLAVAALLSGALAAPIGGDVWSKYEQAFEHTDAPAETVQPSDFPPKVTTPIHRQRATTGQHGTRVESIGG